MADYDKLVEGFFQEEEKDSLDLDDLKALVQEAAQVKSLLERRSRGKERVLKLPILQISENWGKENTVERQELERIVDTATRGQGDVFDKLRVIQAQMGSLASGELGKIKNPRRILSQIMLLETMNRLFKSFQPSPAGFINEALLSVFYGGYQTTAGQANLEKDIGDVTDPDGTPISIKTKGSGHIIVDGSVENLYVSINKAGKVYFDIYEKITTGGKKSHVGTLNVTRFYVNANNINEFLGGDYFKKQGKLLVPVAPFKKGGKDVPMAEAKQTKTQVAQQFAQQIITSPVIIQRREIEKAFTPLSRSLQLIVINAVDKALEAEKDPLKQTVLRANRETLARVEIASRELEKVGKGVGLEREFHLPESKWRPFARAQKFKEIQIKFSDEEIQKLLEQAVEMLDKEIVTIFNSLDGFSKSLNAYLTSLTKNRNALGNQALQYAKQIEPQTQKVVQQATPEKV